MIHFPLLSAPWPATVVATASGRFHVDDTEST